MNQLRFAAPILCALAVLAALDARAQGPAAGATAKPATPATSAAPPAGTPAAPKPPAGPPSAVDVYVLGQGTPIPGVRVTVAADIGRQPEQWNAGDQPPLSSQLTDATGRAHFDAVPAGKYVATTGCNIPDNWIAGNYASRFEAFAGRPQRVTLTMRQGGMIRGRAHRGDRPLALFEVRGEAADALGSACGMLAPSAVDTTTGGFTLRKVPVGATTWVKLDEDAGKGRLSVWKNFHLDKPETLDADFAFPPLEPKDMGSLVIKFRPDTTAPMDSGTTTLTLARPDGAWRYEVQADVGGGKDSVVTVRNVPAGGYQALSKPYPGAKKWWSAPIDSVHVVAGKANEYILHARGR